jgi:hypothetical protein
MSRVLTGEGPWPRIMGSLFIPKQDTRPMTKIITIQSQQRWEYSFEARRTEASLLAVLNELGQKGWELVNAVCYKDAKGVATWGAYLKRPSAAPGAQPGQHEGAVHAAHTTQPDGKTDPLQRFDLSGNEFNLKTE